MTKHKKYSIIVFNRKTGKELYRIPGVFILTEKEAVKIQIDLGTANKLFLLEVAND